MVAARQGHELGAGISEARSRAAARGRGGRRGSACTSVGQSTFGAMSVTSISANVSRKRTALLATSSVVAAR